MKVLYVTSECWPFAKTGGLGDVSYALPKALKKEGVDIRVILPKYSTIPNYLKEKLKEVAVFNVEVGWRNQYCGLLEMELDGIKFYFIDNEYYFKREGEIAYLYGYDDDAERYTFFSNAVLESMSIIDFYPDVIHMNDWHTGMIPLILKEKYSHLEKYRNIKTIYTIHNLQYQGVFSNKVLPDVLGLPQSYLDNGDVEYYGGVNFMKAGIVFSDKVTTVSPTYSSEIQTKYYGYGLDGLLLSNNHKLKGILNGIDYDLNNPSTDNELFFRYDINSIDNKVKNKLRLQEILGLEVNEEIPLIGIVSRLVSQKGFDLISYIMPEILREKLQIVVLGTGEHQYQSMFNYYDSKYPKKVSARIIFNSSLAQQIYAGSDMFLMPSLFEPCGIGQMLAMRYGTLPIVRETGGLKDTVNPYNKYTGEGNGFSFKNYNAHEMLFCIQEAVRTYNDKEKWRRLVINAMNTDSSWEKSAKEYIKTYKDTQN
ncbi:MULTISPECIES: glycogen synthase GlgA [Romboutsia]|uniref:Glycogen synthase n=1 Tax=Romboutsia hominis TaxID=1507512 RepID=A0A2P2BNF4_9FIRM|nr:MULTISPECIES: glycogen synthase GlgA [Romboutsia]MDB8790738.1 glycogen synthase GlgA [Romboutsia sp. 1001216sp1]MDB8794728.1 glycogen synthase GlgA [Romboutsia sp. 1001216sp1]MDB8797577.1 glycogen synthase GlgA [Romboutsia sp. 1001216sp1]MDB8800443.1 glycogen synthase GlgA [Romboutsia sp. 1001216sp1]MDB8803294.1 glycogen synthase GlgA [Romboutsia sp. 1001216sp1]